MLAFLLHLLCLGIHTEVVLNYYVAYLGLVHVALGEIHPNVQLEAV